MRGILGGIVFLALSALLPGCGGGESGTEPPPQSTLSVQAEAYLNEALNIMQRHSINRYEIDWPSFRRRVLAEAGTARSPADTYDAIRFALRELGDSHSFFRPPSGQSQAPPFASPASGAPSVTRFDSGVGYLAISAFSGGGDEADALATQYHRMIESVDTAGVCGWVVDLRGNLGGNMWPMLAGAGPIVGEGVLGFFVDPDSVVQTWTYEFGGSQNDGQVVTRVSDPYRLREEDPAVAVLTDSLTASSGEATTIAFRGRERTRRFGGATWGVSTANRSFTLSDGAMMFLTVSTMADRTGQLYGSKVVPDEVLEGPRTGDPDTDPVLRSGIEWVTQAGDCGG
jgi:carboxyl-terminal processing protease